MATILRNKNGEERQAWIFRMDDCSWYAAHSLMEFLNWYHKTIESIEIPEGLADIEMISPENEMLWSMENVTQEDIEALGDEEYAGDLRRIDGEVFKWQTFEDVLGGEDFEEPFEIATTER